MSIVLSDKSEGNTKRIFRVDKTGQVEGLSEYDNEDEDLDDEEWYHDRLGFRE